jgi:phosphoenolpyruvate carboxykinase (ATP)
LNPRDTWADKDGYDAQAKKLVSMFVTNFDKFMDHVDENVRAAALAAE